MSNAEIKVTVENLEKEEYTTKAVINNNEIKYVEQDNKTVAKYNYATNTLTRRNDTVSLKYEFDTRRRTKGEVNLKGVESTLEVEIETKKLITDNRNLDLEFIVEESNIKYKIEVL